MTKFRPLTLTDLKARCKAAGSHWFESSTLRFFHSKFERKVITLGPDEALFVSSEQCTMGSGEHPRLWSVRHYRGGQVDTLGEFQEHRTREAALRAMATHATRMRSEGGAS